MHHLEKWILPENVKSVWFSLRGQDQLVFPASADHLLATQTRLPRFFQLMSLHPKWQSMHSVVDDLHEIISRQLFRINCTLLFALLLERPGPPRRSHKSSYVHYFFVVYASILSYYPQMKNHQKRHLSLPVAWLSFQPSIVSTKVPIRRDWGGGGPVPIKRGSWRQSPCRLIAVFVRKKITAVGAFYFLKKAAGLGLWLAMQKWLRPRCWTWPNCSWCG